MKKKKRKGRGCLGLNKRGKEKEKERRKQRKEREGSPCAQRKEKKRRRRRRGGIHRGFNILPSLSSIAITVSPRLPQSLVCTQSGNHSLHHPPGMKRKRNRKGTAAAAPTSSSHDGRSGKAYEVFLNFKGPDTRLTIVDCLYHALIRAGIRAFKDDEDLRVGEEIGGSLLQAINHSRIYIIIFSKGYAGSKWCLGELAHMVERKRRRSKDEDEKVIFFIFYDVDADDVKL